jgi:DNA repair protein RecN (Recombination protein N)
VLTYLSIRDLVLIDRLALEFPPGLIVLTGETGAGKSILLDGLGLLLGDRADSSRVRAGAEQAIATASFDCAADHPARALLLEQGLDSDGPITLRRIVRADGGSRAFVNDTPASTGLLRALGACLVEVHGQHDERGLLAPRGHLALLDGFAGLDTGGIGRLWAEREAAEREFAEARARQEADARDRDWLAHAVRELEQLAPQPGEEAELADQRRRMQEGARLAEALEAVEALVLAADGALSQLRQAARRLERLAPTVAEAAQALAAIDRMLVEGDSVEANLASLKAGSIVSPQAVEAAEARLFDLRALARKHRVTPDELPGLAGELRARLTAIDLGEEALLAHEERLKAATAAHLAASEKLHAARVEAALRLDAAVNAELPALRLEAATFRTLVEPAPPGPTGVTRVTFEVATNRGSAFGPLNKIASGGEMSRFVLALKVALAATGTAGTLVFDEIDRGVGGATANAIGTRLARVATAAQVILVTHSPQVAAAGATHFRISKDDGHTQVERLDEEARTLEIARMLSGAAITPEARAQAERLLRAA